MPENGVPENGVPAGNTSDHMAADRVVRIEPWGAGDLPLLEKLMGDPAMMVYLGGPESQEQILERQARYEALMDPRESQMFKIVYAPTGEGVGSVGYWEHDWRGERVYETGWLVLPAFQGRGIAAAATARAIEKVKLAGKHRLLHAFPSVENPASNTLCRKLGFTLMGAYQFEYPRGHFMQCNDWLLDLRADGQESSSQE
jgi:RimJ/RimL family protein N-acetyltransferase